MSTRSVQNRKYLFNKFLLNIINSFDKKADMFANFELQIIKLAISHTKKRQIERAPNSAWSSRFESEIYKLSESFFENERYAEFANEYLYRRIGYGDASFFHKSPDGFIGIIGLSHNRLYTKSILMPHHKYNTDFDFTSFKEFVKAYERLYGNVTECEKLMQQALRLQASGIGKFEGSEESES